MARQVIKLARDRDLYVGWSDVTNAPTWFGTRAQVSRYLVDELASWAASPRGALVPDAKGLRILRQDAEAMLARADQYGSSAVEVGFTWWIPTITFGGRQLDRAGLARFVDWAMRSHVVDYAAAVRAGRRSAAADLERYGSAVDR